MPENSQFTCLIMKMYPNIEIHAIKQHHPPRQRKVFPDFTFNFKKPFKYRFFFEAQTFVESNERQWSFTERKFVKVCIIGGKKSLYLFRPKLGIVRQD